MAAKAGLVAVVDDDAAVLDSMRFLLEVAGLRVACYSSAAAFLAGGGEADCLIVDQNMPLLSGLELIAALPGGTPRRNIMLITGSFSPTVRERALMLGVGRVAEKPLPESELLDFVSACLQRQGVLF